MVASRRASPRASTLLDLQSGAPGQASIRSTRIVLVDDQAERRAPLRMTNTRCVLAHAEIDRAPRRQAQIAQRRHLPPASTSRRSWPASRSAERRGDADRADPADRAACRRQPQSGTATDAPRPGTCANAASPRPRMRPRVATAEIGMCRCDGRLGRLAGGTCAEPLRSIGVSRPKAIASPTAGEADIGALGGDRDRAATIDQQAELGRQCVQALVLRQGIGDRARDRADIAVCAGSRPASGADHDIARRFGLGIGSSRPSSQRSPAARASAPRSRPRSCRLARRVRSIWPLPSRSRRARPVPRACSSVKAPHARPHAHDQPVAARHRPQDARAPALDLEAAATLMRRPSVIARVEFERSTEVAPRDPQAARQRIAQPRRRSPPWPPGSSPASRPARPRRRSSAACVASNRWPGTASAVAAKA